MSSNGELVMEAIKRAVREVMMTSVIHAGEQELIEAGIDAGEEIEALAEGIAARARFHLIELFDA